MSTPEAPPESGPEEGSSAPTEAVRWLATQYRLCRILEQDRPLEERLAEVIEEASGSLAALGSDGLRIDLYGEEPGGEGGVTSGTETGEIILVHGQPGGLVRAGNGAAGAAHDAVCELVTSLALRVGALLERERLEEVLRGQVKMGSLGLFARGVAHDFNNHLVGVLGNAELMMLELPPESPLMPMAEDIQECARNAAELARQVLRFSGKDPSPRCLVTLHDIIRESGALLRILAHRRARLTVEVDAEGPHVEVDQGAVRDALVYLVRNAADAAPSIQGQIRVLGGRETLGQGEPEAPGRMFGTPEPGEYAFFEVIDDGPGLEAGELERIFQPFHTTRAGAPGLGLTETLSIVEAHGGGIRVVSQPGEGSTFRVLLPCSG